MSAPLPDTEHERLVALHRLLLLDTPPEERFDRITRLAAEQLDVPIALISLVDAERQWFKSRRDPAARLLACETPRDVAFCAHAILHEDVLVVEDALSDPRFAANPLVVGPPGLRFYAGAPLEVGPGLRVGTLCVIDVEPRRFDEAARGVLRSLRDLVLEEMHGRGDSGAGRARETVPG